MREFAIAAPVTDRVQETFDRLLAHYGPQGWWPAETPFEAIVGALLMSHTAWRNVETAIRNLTGSGLLEETGLSTVTRNTTHFSWPMRKHSAGMPIRHAMPVRCNPFATSAGAESDKGGAVLLNTSWSARSRSTHSGRSSTRAGTS